MNRPSLRIGLTAAALILAGCSTSTSELNQPSETISPSATGASASTDPATSAGSNTTTEPTTSTSITETPVSSSGVVLVVRELLDLLARGDLDGASLHWSGYPFNESEKVSHLQQMMGLHPWLIDGSTELRLVEAVLRPPFVTEVVVAVNGNDAAAFVLSPSQNDVAALIQRIPIDPPSTQIDNNTVSVGDQVLFNRFPIEGGAVAFVGGTETKTLVDPDSGTTTSVIIPDVELGPAVITLVVATPELASAVAVVVNIAE